MNFTEWTGGIEANQSLYDTTRKTVVKVASHKPTRVSRSLFKEIHKNCNKTIYKRPPQCRCSINAVAVLTKNNIFV